MILKHYYRVQGISEALNDYVRNIKMYARVLRISNSEKEAVNIISDGLSPVKQSCLAFDMHPRTFLKLDAHCVRVMTVLHADALRGKPNVQRGLIARTGGVSATVSDRSTAASNSHIVCYHCRAPGHVVWECPMHRDHITGNQANQYRQSRVSQGNTVLSANSSSL